jgi:hypothetical protein
MKTSTSIKRYKCLILTTIFLMSGVLLFSQETASQKAQFGFHDGFYFPEQKINHSEITGDTSIYLQHDPGQETAVKLKYSPLLSWENSPNDSSRYKNTDPLCRIPQYNASELKTMHEQQDFMWEQYYRMWQKQTRIEAYSIDVEGLVRGSKK